MRLLIKSLFIAGASALAAAPVASAESEYWEQRASLFDILPVNSGDIVFLGNSITDGGEFAELFGMSNIKNRGISADVVKGVEKRLDRVIENQPRKIFLLIGINDVSHNLSADRIASDYARIVKRIRKEAPRSELYIQSVMPVNNDFKRYKNLLGKERVIPELNGKLRTLAESTGAHYVDLWPALADPATGKLRREFTNDGLHLTGKGYKAWTAAIDGLVRE